MDKSVFCETSLLENLLPFPSHEWRSFFFSPLCVYAMGRKGEIKKKRVKIRKVNSCSNVRKKEHDHLRYIYKLVCEYRNIWF